MKLTGFDLCRAAMSVEGTTAPEQSVLLVLAIMANEDRQCWPGINGPNGLTGKTKLSERTVQRAVQGLKDAGHISWVEKPGRGRIYVVHPRHSDTPKEATPAAVTPRQADTRQSGTPVTVTPTPVTVTPKQPRTTNTSTDASHPPRSREPKLKPSRLPDDWQPTRFADSTVARDVIDRRGVEWARAALESFRAWAANAEDKDGVGRKLNWQAAWSKWVIEQDKRDGNRTQRRLDAQPDLRGSRPDPSLDLLRSARAAEEAERAAGGGQDNWGAWAALPPVGSG